jgi:hypothetical protein
MIRASTLTSQRRLLRNPSRRRIEPDRRIFTPPRRSAGCGDGIHIVQFWAVCPQRSSLPGDAANSVHGYDEGTQVGITGRADERTGGGPVKQAAQKPGSTSLNPSCHLS